MSEESPQKPPADATTGPTPGPDAETGAPALPSANESHSPAHADSPPPPMSFAGSAGTGAIMVDTGSAPESTPVHDHEAPIVLEPLHTGTPPIAPVEGIATEATAKPEYTGGFRRARGANAGLSASPAPVTTGTEAGTGLSPAPVTAGPAEHSFQLLSFVALFALALILAVQQFTSIYIPSIFTNSELGFAGMYEYMLASSQWLSPPHLANIPAALPVYFWFMRLVDAIPYADGRYLYPLVSACSAFVALAGAYALGLATGLGNRLSFAAGLILLSSLGFTPLGHFLSPDLFFAGMLALSMACLYRGWVSQQSYTWLALGFALAGLSTLTGGLMGLVVPLLTSLGFVVWRGTFRRGHQLDAVFGFALLLVIILGWLGAIILLTGENTYLYTLIRQIFTPFIGPLWPPQDPWWLYAVRVPVALLPWVLVVLFVPWGRVCATAWPNLKASRSEKSGSAWLWISLFVCCLYLIVISTKPCLNFVPILPFAALVLAKALLGLPAARSRGFFMLLALVFALAALALVGLSIPFALTALTPYLPAPMMKALQHVQGLPLMAGVCGVSALLLWKGTRRALPAGSLLVTVLLVTMLIQPMTLLLSPSLKGVAGDEPASAPQVAPQVAPVQIAPEQSSPQTAPAQIEPAQSEAAPHDAPPEATAPNDAPQAAPPAAVAPAVTPDAALSPTEPAPVQAEPAPAQASVAP